MSHINTCALAHISRPEYYSLGWTLTISLVHYPVITNRSSPDWRKYSSMNRAALY